MRMQQVPDSLILHTGDIKLYLKAQRLAEKQRNRLTFLKLFGKRWYVESTNSESDSDGFHCTIVLKAIMEFQK